MTQSTELTSAGDDEQIRLEPGHQLLLPHPVGRRRVPLESQQAHASPKLNA